MAPLQSTLAILTTLGTAVLVIALDAPGRRWVTLANDSLESPVFPIPDQLPAHASLMVDGSSTMALANEVFRQRMAERYPNLTIQVATSGTDAALEKLRRGEVEVAAIGRRLTEAERNQGLVEVPISREKIALVVGADNPFGGGITLDQLAQMFYGEINNWAAVGGPDVPLRFVDRPPTSDTRQALGQYPGFGEKGLSPGPTVTPVAEDSTEAVIEALGNDGIGYAVVSQVKDRENLRILTVDDVLPTDGRYPYSQPRVYVYNSNNPTPSALAFLGVVNAPANLAPPTADLTAADPAHTNSANTEAVSSEAASTTPASTAPATAAPMADPTATEVATATPADAPQSTTPRDPSIQPRPWGSQGQAWGWLLAIPLLGGLFWWLLNNQAQRSEPESSLGVVTGATTGRIVLTPRHCRRAYAYWEVPDELRAQQRERGGRTLTLRLLDVTDRDVERHPPSRIDPFPVTEDQQDLHLPIPADNRDYQVELGYVSQENHWLPLVKSAAVHVPACAVASGSPAA